MKKFTSLFLMMVYAFLAAGAPAYSADDTTNQNASELISQAEEAFRQEDSKLKAEPLKKVQIDVNQGRFDIDPANKDFTLFVREIRIEGNTVFAEDVIRKYVEPFEYQETSVNDLNKLAETFTELYRMSGFTNGHAVLPPQKIKDGVVTLRFEEFPTGDGPVFFVRKIQVEGSTVLKERDFEKFTTPFEYNEATFAQLQALTLAITNLYRGRGYLTSRAYVPPQKMEDGVVVIKCLEGRVGQVHVEGNKYFAGWIYKDAIRPRPGEIFKYQELESSLSFLNQKPDRSAKAYLIAGEEIGLSDVFLKAEDKYPIHAAYEFNNRGTKLTHHSRHEVSMDHNNFLGRADSLAAKAMFAEEGALNGGSFQYEIPVASSNSSLHLDGSYVESLLVAHLKSQEFKGRSFSMSPSLHHRFIETPPFVLDGMVGFDYKDSRSSRDDVKTTYDKTRVLKLGPYATFQDQNGRTVLSGNINWGIPNFWGGLSSVDLRASRPNTGGEFTYLTASAARVQRLPLSTFLLLRWGGMWSEAELPSSEQYRAGGVFSVRGYPESDSAGDYGHNFSAEMNFPLRFLPDNWTVPQTKKKWNETFRMVAFMDGAKTFLRNRALDTTPKSKFLLGTGFGVRFNLDETFSLRVDFGFPIGDDSTDERDKMQTHISVRAGF